MPFAPQETAYQHALEQVLKGTHKRMGVHGISDITTDLFHAEIKEWKKWRGSISQLWLYNKAAPRSELRLYLFGDRPPNDVVKTVVGIIKSYGIASFQVLISDDTNLQIINLETSDVSNHSFERQGGESSQLLSDDEKAELDAMMSVGQSDIVVNLDRVAKWLNVLKNNLLQTLRNSYVLDVDYTVKKGKNPVKMKYGSNNYSEVRVSPSCFKQLVMRSNSKNSAPVRMYLLHIEVA